MAEHPMGCPFLSQIGLLNLLTEKSGSSHQKHNSQHNDVEVTSLGSLLGMPVKLSNGIADKKTIKLTYTGDLLVSKLAVWLPCMGNRA